MAEKPRILVVDDEASIIDTVKVRLQFEGYDVLIARDGQEGLTIARAEQPALVILDLLLPKLNGYEVCAMLKQDTRCQKIPIMMFTAKARDEDEKRGYECGADAYIRKPFKTAELLETIRTLIKAGEGPGKGSP